MVDMAGDPADIAKDTIYVVFYSEDAPQQIGTPVFQSASRGGGGGIIPSVAPIMGKQIESGDLVDKSTPFTIVSSGLTMG